ncbi:MAG: hypothetical protein ACXVJN_00985 [Mucilaginibacter sp.]
MKGFVIFITVICLFSCKPKYNPEAIKLNDSAIMMRTTMTGDQLEAHIGKDSFAKIQLGFLNRATKIDSNYLLGYWNKFPIQYTLKQYANALITAKKIVWLSPKNVVAKYLLGKVYDKTGDTMRAGFYYKYYLGYCDSILDTMSVGNRQHKSIELQKAVVLILLNQPQKGHDILNKLYQEADAQERDEYLLYMRLTRADFLIAKDTSITVGQSTTSINTFFP